jgi:hypothetical protein
MTLPATTATLVEWALWYGAQGQPIFPLFTPTSTGCSCRNVTCTDIGKHPRITGWQARATTDAETIQQWWTQWPEANIGLRTGITAWVLDVDPRHGGKTTLDLLEDEHGPLPDTPRVLTGGGGEHWYFAMPEAGRVGNRVSLAPGLDVRSLGGLIVLPPSAHASGKTYQWNPLFDLEDYQPAPAPAWLLALVQSPVSAPQAAPDSPIASGKRNETLSRMAFAMRRANMSLEEIYQAIAVVNARCTPPLDDEELKLIAEGKRHIGPDPVLKMSPGAKERTAPPKRAWPELIPATDIITTSYAAPAWLIPGLITEGLTIIGGLPKVAKSYLAYDIALACAGLGLGLGHFGVARGNAAYFAIEDDAADTKMRIQQLRPSAQTIPGLFFLHGENVPGISEGLVEYLRQQVTQHDLRLVVIDPLAYVYDPPHGKTTDSFREAKDMLLPLRQLARELHFALLFVDHRRKQSKDDMDVFQTLYGSVAKYAVADSLIMVVKRGDETTLHCRGRKIKDQVLTCDFHFTEDNLAVWAVHSAQDPMSAETLRGKILNAFKAAENLTKRRVFSVDAVFEFMELEATKHHKDMVRQSIFRMYKVGLLQRNERGLFFLAGDDDSQGVII